MVAELWLHVYLFILHLFAALAEKERALISVRTKAARSRGQGAGRYPWGTPGSLRPVRPRSPPLL